MVGTAMTGASGDPVFQIVIFQLAFREREPPAVIIDHDGDMIRILEGGRAAVECGIVEVPLRRRDLPDQLRKIVPIFVIAGAAALGRKIDTGTTIGAPRLAVTAPCWIAGLGSDSR